MALFFERFSDLEIAGIAKAAVRDLRAVAGEHITLPVPDLDDKGGKTAMRMTAIIERAREAYKVFHTITGQRRLDLCEKSYKKNVQNGPDREERFDVLKQDVQYRESLIKFIDQEWDEELKSIETDAKFSN